MSTEHQRFSPQNQAAAIGIYALTHGFEVIRTYLDDGKSGLTLRGREGLQHLLRDAMSPARDFETILVLDVSRWGRFQDPDQSGHYEFICREAGVDVRYCSEPFDNDGSLVATIVKHLKRVMAAEYSRELSAKIKQAKRHQASLGLHQGGSAQFGFRRRQIDEQGVPGVIFENGQWKPSRVDRTVLMLGPPSEIELVQLIFQLFVQDKLSPRAIVQQLKARGGPTPRGRPWTTTVVRTILTNEIYVGTCIFGKTSRTLQRKQVRTPPDSWLRTKVMEPIVSAESFAAAGDILKTNTIMNLSQEEKLQRLERLLSEKGHLSTALIKECKYTPHPHTYRDIFGSLFEAYRRIGYFKVCKRSRKPDGCFFSDDELLDGLRRILSAHGYLTSKLIDADRDMPNSALFYTRFGTLTRAYALVGFVQSPSESVAAAHQRAGRRYNWRGQQRPTDVPYTAARVINADGSQLTDEQLLDALRILHTRHGYVSELLMAFEPNFPPISYYHKRFGGLRKAYALAGFPHSVSEILLAAHARRRQSTAIAG